ncbi:hypothetical protein BDY19DRAFT_1092222 [Irpex rosettiformis]|uniref:Uncharacterized protein n=1 Tax=Irpex rosettiformis TaxID=378272 RepID=A0ACB8TYF9_9APHY|nr:hypothetical protein BDY19DRAFT_1092222 [Irpex rosettiformis]
MGTVEGPSRRTSISTPPRDEPFSHGILDEDEGSRRALKMYLKPVVGATVMIWLVIWSVLALYWGANWKVFSGLHNLDGWVVDFDGGIIGSTVISAYMNATGAKEQISWHVIPASEFPGGEADLPKAVLGEKCWIAVSISSGASDRLSAAIASANTSYDNSAAVTLWGNEARNENAYSFFLEQQLEGPMPEAIAAFALQQSQQLGSNADSLLRTAPKLVLSPLNYTLVNLKPFDIQVATAVDFVGLIYLLILSFIAALANFQARVMISGIDRRLRFKQLLILRFVAPFTIYFWLSFVFSLLSLFFKVPFDRKFGHAGFFIYWMLSWSGMLALGLSLEAMITLLTPRFIPFFLVLWIIVNVSVVFFPVEILPTIFRYGYATPFYNVGNATRTILFGTRNQVGLNFGVLFAWIGISLITIPLFQGLVRRGQVKEWRKKMGAEQNRQVEEKQRRMSSGDDATSSAGTQVEVSEV